MVIHHRNGLPIHYIHEGVIHSIAREPGIRQTDTGDVPRFKTPQTGTLKKGGPTVLYRHVGIDPYRLIWVPSLEYGQCKIRSHLKTKDSAS